MPSESEGEASDQAINGPRMHHLPLHVEDAFKGWLDGTRNLIDVHIGIENQAGWKSGGLANSVTRQAMCMSTISKGQVLLVSTGPQAKFLSNRSFGLIILATGPPRNGNAYAIRAEEFTRQYQSFLCTLGEWLPDLRVRLWLHDWMVCNPRPMKSNKIELIGVLHSISLERRNGDYWPLGGDALAEAWLYRNADRLFAVGQATTAAFNEQEGDTKCETLWNLYPHEKPCEQPSGLHKRVNHVNIVCRAAAQKDVCWLNKLLAADYGHSLEYHFYGSAQGDEWGRGRVKSNGAQVVFHGQVPHQEVLRGFTNAKIALLPSKHEPYGLALAEGVYNGCLMLARLSTSLGLALKAAGLHGVLPDDPDAAVAYIHEIMHWPDDYLQRATASQDQLLRRLSVSTIDTLAGMGGCKAEMNIKEVAVRMDISGCLTALQETKPITNYRALQRRHGWKSLHADVLLRMYDVYPCLLTHAFWSLRISDALGDGSLQYVVASPLVVILAAWPALVCCSMVWIGAYFRSPVIIAASALALMTPAQVVIRGLAKTYWSFRAPSRAALLVIGMLAALVVSYLPALRPPERPFYLRLAVGGIGAFQGPGPNQAVGNNSVVWGCMSVLYTLLVTLTWSVVSLTTPHISGWCLLHPEIVRECSKWPMDVLLTTVLTFLLHPGVGSLMCAHQLESWSTAEEGEAQQFKQERSQGLRLLLMSTAVFGDVFGLIVYTMAWRWRTYLTALPGVRLLVTVWRMSINLALTTLKSRVPHPDVKERQKFVERLYESDDGPSDILMVPFGTRGDWQPMEYAKDIMTAIGLPARFINLRQSMDGRELLAASEEGHVIGPGLVAAEVSLQIDAVSLDRPLVVAPPHVFILSQHRVLYLPHPTFNVGGELHLQEPLLDGALHALTRNVERGLSGGGHYQGLPHTADGQHATQRMHRPKKCTGKRIAFASSSPTENKRLQDMGYEPLRGDHPQLASQADSVTYHGGAGTRLSILAGGAAPISTSDALDRGQLVDRMARPYFHSRVLWACGEVLGKHPRMLQKWLEVTKPEPALLLDIFLLMVSIDIQHLCGSLYYNLHLGYRVMALFSGFVSLEGLRGVLDASKDALSFLLIISAEFTERRTRAQTALRELSVGDALSWARVFLIMAPSAVERQVYKWAGNVALALGNTNHYQRLLIQRRVPPSFGSWIGFFPVHGLPLPWTHVFLVIDSLVYEVGMDPDFWIATPRCGAASPKFPAYYIRIPDVDVMIACSVLSRVSPEYGPNNNCASYVRDVLLASLGPERPETRLAEAYARWAAFGIAAALRGASLGDQIGMEGVISEGLREAARCFGEQPRREYTDDDLLRLDTYLSSARSITGVPLRYDKSQRGAALEHNAHFQRLFEVGAFKDAASLIGEPRLARRLFADWLTTYAGDGYDTAREYYPHVVKDEINFERASPDDIDNILDLLIAPQPEDLETARTMSIQFLSAMRMVGPVFERDKNSLRLLAYQLEGEWPGAAVLITAPDSGQARVYQLDLIDAFVLPNGGTPHRPFRSQEQQDQVVQKALRSEEGEPVVSWWDRAQQFLTPNGPLDRARQAILLCLTWLEAMLVATTFSIERWLWVPKANGLLRHNPKTVWAFTGSSVQEEKIPELRPKLFRSDKYTYAMPEKLGQDWSPEQVIEEGKQWMKEHAPSHIAPATLRPHMRKFRLTPRMNDYLKGRTRRAMEVMKGSLGVNAATRFSTEAEAASVARYSLDSPVTEYGEKVLAAATAHFADRYQAFFAHTDVWSKRMFMKNLVMKYGPGPLLEGAQLTEDGWHKLGSKPHMRRLVDKGIRRRADARSVGLLDAIEKGIISDLRTGRTLRTIHGLFPKDYVDYAWKLDADPTKMRTIVPMFMRDHRLQAHFNGTLNKRASNAWQDMPFAIGMPMTGAGYALKFKSAATRKFHTAFDFKAADSRFSAGLLRQIAELRSRGFREHPQHEAIAEWIHRNYEAMQEGAIHSYVTGRLYVKATGASTGQFSVTLDNSLAVELTLMAAIAEVCTTPISEVLDVFEIINMSDDGTLHTDLPITNSDLCAIQEWITVNTGQVVTFSRLQDSLEGLEFCKKTFLPWDEVPDEKELEGLPLPNYAVVHDRDSLIMRQTAVPFRCDFRTLYLRCAGHALLTSHLRPVYDFLKAESERLTRLIKQQLGGETWLKKHRFPTYRRVLELHYAPVAPFQSATPSAWDLYLHYELAALKWIDKTKSWLRFIGAGVFAGERLGAGRNYPMATKHNYVENFIYHAAGRPENIREIASAIQYGPVGMLSDFESFAEVGPNTRPGFDRAAAGATQAVMALTSLGIIAMRSLASVPVLRIFWYVYRFFYFDIGLVYGMFSGVVFLATGRPSLTLATLVPRDPWLPIKRVAVILVDILPPQAFYPILPQRVLEAFADLVETIALRAVAINPTEHPNTQALGDLPVSKWAEFSTSTLLPALGRGKHSLVVAPTGTGKTMGLLSHVIKHWKGRVYITLPRVALRDEAGKALNLPVLQRGSKLGAPKACVATVGHLSARIAHGNMQVSNKDLIVLDEVHEPNPIAYKLVAETKHATILGLTATPNAWSRTCLPKSVRTFHPQVRKPHNTTHLDWAGTTPVQALQRLSRELQQKETRILVICGTMQAVRECERAFEGCKIPFSVWTARTRPPKRGHVIATTVAESGVTLPGLTHVIDYGDRIVQHDNVLMRVNVDKATASQRAGRVGRTGAGVAIRLAPIIEGEYQPAPSLETYCLNPAVWSNYIMKPEHRPLGTSPGSPGLLKYVTLQCGEPRVDLLFAEASLELQDKAVTAHLRFTDTISEKAAIARIELGHTPDALEDLFEGLTLDDRCQACKLMQGMMRERSIWLTSGGVSKQYYRPGLSQTGCMELEGPSSYKDLLTNSTPNPQSTTVSDDTWSRDTFTPAGDAPKSSLLELLHSYLVNGRLAQKEQFQKWRRKHITASTTVEDLEHMEPIQQVSNKYGLVVEIDVTKDFNVVIRPQTFGTTRLIRTARVPSGWVCTADRGTAKYGMWDGQPASRVPATSYNFIRGGQVAGKARDSNIVRTADVIQFGETRSRYVHNVPAQTWLDNMIACEKKGGEHCILKTLSAWEKKIMSVENACDIVNPFLRSQPYIDRGDCRSTAEVLNRAYGCNVSANDGFNLNWDVRDLLVVWANLNACVVLILQDETGEDGAHIRGTLSPTQNRPKGQSKITARERILRNNRRAMALLQGCNQTYEATLSTIHPLRSLSGRRAHATGSYAVACRIAEGHLQPMIFEEGMKGPKAGHTTFWGNSHVAQLECRHHLVKQVLHITENILADEIEVDTKVIPCPGVVLPRQGMAINFIEVTEPQCIVLPTRGVLCRNRWHHRRVRGFKGTKDCAICSAIQDVKAGHDILNVLSKKNSDFILDLLVGRRILNDPSARSNAIKITYQNQKAFISQILVADQRPLSEWIRANVPTKRQVAYYIEHQVRAESGYSIISNPLPPQRRKRASEGDSLSSLSMDSLGRLHGRPGSRWSE